MCLTVPARVLSVDGESVRVEVRGVERQAKCFVSVSEGDFVEVGMGVVLGRISRERFDELASFSV
ncbi:MAG: HypC/HybG/HupF family hydrogenase formation chaperone [Candidatus Diapherotrites archaeon]|nr:HypC/HybG/HupF family hydrogenase formation chaperone [Candidatus Diapherotrites archaeon]